MPLRGGDLSACIECSATWGIALEIDCLVHGWGWLRRGGVHLGGVHLGGEFESNSREVRHACLPSGYRQSLCRLRRPHNISKLV